jgi:hypothetical protein
MKLATEYAKEKLLNNGYIFSSGECDSQECVIDFFDFDGYGYRMVYEQVINLIRTGGHPLAFSDKNVYAFENLSLFIEKSGLQYRLLPNQKIVGYEKTLYCRCHICPSE